MSDLLAEVAAYYSDKLAQHGATPQGVDWNGEESQQLRFMQLSRIIGGEPFSLTDIGCGYGAYLDYLGRHHDAFSYTGIDIAPSMVAAAKQQYAAHKNARFEVGDMPSAPTDYCIASGIFNVRQQRSDTEWERYIEATLSTMEQHSTRGYAVNFLPSDADEDKKRAYLYYAEPARWSAYCSAHGKVELLRDYGLYEFTLLVRR